MSQPVRHFEPVDMSGLVRGSRRSPSWPSGASSVVGVIGDPILHSLSPVLHNAAFGAMGLDWVSVAFRVRQGELRGALAGMRALEIVGLSVTTPHKDDAAMLVDDLTPLAARLGAVNCLTRQEQVVRGDSTDGEGFLAALRRSADFEVRGSRCAVLGAGGAARAVILALAQAGAAEVVVINRTPERAERAAALAGAIGRIGNTQDVARAELIVQATSLGMAGDPEMPVDAGLIKEGQLVVDIVYKPAVTPFLEAAKARGARTVGGLGMLVHQAALAVEHWTGTQAPVEAMWAAVHDPVAEA